MSETYSLIKTSQLPAVSDPLSYMQAIARFPILTEEQEFTLAVAQRDHNCRRSALELICAHLRQVAAIARTYRGYGLPEMDLIQEGNIGLMHAVRKFDPDRKVRLSTYATYWIRAAINEYVIRNWKIVRVATTAAQRKLFFNLRRMVQKLGRRMSIQDSKDIAAELDVPRYEVLEMEKRMINKDMAFDAPLNAPSDELDVSPSATVAADEGMHAGISVIDNSIDQDQKEVLAEALATLTERERDIIMHRTLSASGKDSKLRTLAERYSISSERVRQLEKKALAKIKQHVLANYEA